MLLFEGSMSSNTALLLVQLQVMSYQIKKVHWGIRDCKLYGLRKNLRGFFLAVHAGSVVFFNDIRVNKHD